MDALTTELELRWQRMFTALAEGGDVPPSGRLRAEGMMEAAVLLGLATAEEILPERLILLLTLILMYHIQLCFY